MSTEKDMATSANNNDYRDNTDDAVAVLVLPRMMSISQVHKSGDFDLEQVISLRV